MFDTEVYTIAQALSVLNLRQETNRKYAIFVDSTSAIDRIRTDSIGPGQSFAISAIDCCTNIHARQNEVTIHWVPAHHGVPGNEKADEFARVAAEGSSPGSAVADELQWEASLSRMTRVATENQSRRMSQWIAEHIGDPRRKYRIPPGKGVRRKLLRWVPKHVAGRYFQLLPGHAVIGPYLKDKMRKSDDDRCWSCG